MVLIDYRMFKRRMLYIMIIDFQKAYDDKAKRTKLIESLTQRVCGEIMLLAIQAAYQSKHW